MSKVWNVGIEQYRYYKIRVCDKDSMSDNAIANKLGLHIYQWKGDQILLKLAQRQWLVYNFFKNSTKTGQAKRSKTKWEPADVSWRREEQYKYILTIDFIKDLKNNLVKS